MPLEKERVKRLHKAITRHTKAQVEASWAGSLPPEEASGVRAEAQAAKRSLTALLEEIDRYGV